MKNSSKKFDLKAIAAKQHDDMVEWLKIPRFERLGVTNPDGFNVESLGHWLEVCKMVNVGYVPAELLHTFDIEDLLVYDEHPSSLLPGFDIINKAKKPNYMLRWDVCAPYDVKSGMGTGKYEWDESYLYLTPDDPRGYDLIYAFPESTMKVWLRPWIKAQIIDSYPVEYRVFVLDNEVIGVSNYYPQRPLPENDDIMLDLHIVTKLTTMMVENINPPWNNPKMDKLGFNKDTISCTLDFLRTEDGKILFLEGGPPHHPAWGAHMCCFQPGKIKGIALEDRNN